MSEYKPTPITPKTPSGLTVDTVNALPEATQVWEGILPANLNRFGIKVTPTEVFFPYFKEGSLVGYKVRRLGAEHTNRFYSIGEMKDPEMFGSTLIRGSGKRLYITEGEKDAVSLYQIIKGASGGSFSADVLSIPTGASISQKTGKGTLDKVVMDERELFEKYEHVVVVLDQDAPGKAVSVAFGEFLEKRALLTGFNGNDINEMLKAGKGAEVNNACWNAKPWSPSKILDFDQALTKALKPRPPAIPYPWPSLNALTDGGMHPGELIGIVSGVKIGKTLSIFEIAKSLIYDHNKKVAVFLLENTVQSTLLTLSSKFLGRELQRQDSQKMDDNEQQLVREIVQDKLWIYDHEGARDWAEIESYIRYLAIQEGVKHFFLEPLTSIQPGDAGRANEFLQDMVRDLAAMVNKYGLTVFYSTHLNNPISGPPHEENGRVKLNQITGSKSMMRNSHLIWGIERNIAAEDLTERNTSTFRILANRATGEYGTFEVLYEPDGSYREGTKLRLAGGHTV